MTNVESTRRVKLQGRVFIQGDIVALTGLHIGGAAGALEIGGVDSPIIRNPLNNQPYIPGSSLRGKMRSLNERLHGSAQNFQIGWQRGKEVFLHTCQLKLLEEIPGETWEQRVARYRLQYADCPVCSVFGVTGDEPVSHPTSLVVRDVYLSDASVKKLNDAQTDFPYTEIKWEATIDRVTSAATPRQIERVPAGAVFEGFELVYNIYDKPGLSHFAEVLKAMQLLEEDYLGGLGSRGGGKVAFKIKKIFARVGESYQTVLSDFDPQPEPPGIPLTDELAASVQEWVGRTFAAVE